MSEKPATKFIKKAGPTSPWAKLRAIPNPQKFRYVLIVLSCVMFFAPLLLIPSLAGSPDLCGELCMRRFYLYFPGMDLADLGNKMSVAWIGVIALITILVTTFFFGRMWCSYICPVGGFPEMISRMLNDHWKIEYRSLPQVPIRYGYFAFFLVAMPMLGISACTLCNFITVPRIFEAFAGGFMGVAFIFSTVGIVNLALLFLLGFFASKGRAYCQFFCPIGAMDGLVNRLGAMLHFTRHIRVERDRCTGCNICARNCMTGAIKMVDKIAVVDQHSCMSCHECVDVCDWNAIEWLAAPKKDAPKRTKKGIEIHPQPEWEAHHNLHPVKSHWRSIHWQRLVLLLIVGITLLFIVVTRTDAAERQIDPDGCLSCHALKNLSHIDKNGVFRNASIDQSHFLSSLHGSVPCKDCHRKIEDYPHEVENGAVNCAESCHVEEPSGAEPYSHENIAEEFADSVHGKGWSKGLTGGNRLEETEKEVLPSCRKCHANDAYISKKDMPKFKDSFAHIDTECGKCHQGEVWLSQFGGHILRRFIGARWNKNDHNKICNECHADEERMAKVEIENKKTGEKEPVKDRFIHASHSYSMTLHGRLLATGVEDGASCIDCHAPKEDGLRHNILRDEDLLSSTHSTQLAETCAASGCHGYATHPLNTNFVNTDMHDIDMIAMVEEGAPMAWTRFDSNWSRAFTALLPLAAILGVGSLLALLFGKRKKGVIFAHFGGGHFQEKMIGRRAKTKRKKEKQRAKKKEMGERK